MEGVKIGKLAIFEHLHWRKKVWQINISANRLLIISINLNNFIMDSKCSYTCIDELLIVCWTVEELERQLKLMIMYNLSRIREI